MGVDKQKVIAVGVKREYGWLYFVDDKGDISRVRQQRRNRVVRHE